MKTTTATSGYANMIMRTLAAVLLLLLLAAPHRIHAQNLVFIPNGITNVNSNLAYDGIASGTAQQLIIDIGNTSSLLIADSATLTVSNNNNSASILNAGALYVAPNASLTIAPQPGGAGSGALVFAKNTGTFGGAIFASSSVTIGVKSFFTSNTASDRGGAIYVTADLMVTDYITATGNSATSYGGAICVNSSFNRVSTGSNATFIGNKASYGGAISAAIWGASVNIGANARFERNGAAANNGDSYFNSSGGAIFADGTVTIGNNAVFISNTVSHYGGAIRGGGNINIGDNFTATGNVAGVFGGVIYQYGFGNVSIGSHATFIGNIARDSTGNYGHGGAIDVSDTVTIGDHALFASNTAVNCSAIAAGRAIIIGDYFTATNNTSIDGRATGYSSNGSGVLSLATGADTMFLKTGSNAIFANNSTAGTCSVIYNTGSAVIDANSSFTGNRAQTGGAIYTLRFLKLTDATFLNNSSGATNAAGAIYNSGGTIAINVGSGFTSAFIGNTAGSTPSSIYNDSGLYSNDTTIIIDITPGGVLDMADPITGNASASNIITITSTNAGLWKLGGTNTFTTSTWFHGGVACKANLTVSAGTLHLYGNDEFATDCLTRATTGAIRITDDPAAPASSFTLGGAGRPATLKLGGANSITAPSIKFAQGSIITFASPAGAGDSFKLSGSVSFDSTTWNIRTAIGNTSDNLTVTGPVAFAGANNTLNILSLSTGTFALLSSNNTLAPSATAAFTIRHNAAPLPHNWTSALSLGSDGKSLLLTLDNPAVAAAQQLKIQLESTGTATVTVNGAVDLSLVDGATVTRGKAITGADANATIAGDLAIASTASNTIILGVNFTAGTLAINGAKDMAVTHCTFADAPVTITANADNIAFSWNKFIATAGASLAGARAMTIANAGATTGILLHHNLWGDGLKTNMPLATNARVHMYNNYFTTTGNTSATISGSGAQILSRNNIYQGVHNPLTQQNGGLIRALDNFALGTTGTTAPGADNVFVPAYSHLLNRTGLSVPGTDALADLVATNAGNTAGNNSRVTPAPTPNVSARITATVTGTTLPASATSAIVPLFETFTLTATATNFTPTASHQWYRDNFAVPGATTGAYAVAEATATHAGSYSVTLTTPAGELVASSAFKVAIGSLVAPLITENPVSLTVTAGQPATFTVTATGHNLNYQWQKNNGTWTNIPGATATNYTITSAQQTDTGSYRAQVSNASGTATSNAATLTVNPASSSGGGGGSAPSLLWLAALAVLLALRRRK